MIGMAPGFQLNQEEKEYFERLTGRMPIFLKILASVFPRECADIGAATLTPATGGGPVDKVAEIRTRMASSDEVVRLEEGIRMFARYQKKALANNADELGDWHRAWRACIMEEMVDLGGAQSLDGRYFYVSSNGTGRCSCDLARTAAAAYLHKLEDISLYSDSVWVHRLPLVKGNPSVRGFVCERVAIATLEFEGCLHAGSEFQEALQYSVFETVQPPERASSGANTPIIFIPVMWNYPAVDCILVHKAQVDGKTRAVVVGVQITISPNHKPSESPFMSRWDDWTRFCLCDNTEFRFVWIVERRRQGQSFAWETVEEKRQDTKSSSKVVRPTYKRRYVTFHEINKNLGDRLAGETS